MLPLWLLLFYSLSSWAQSGLPHKWLDPLHGPDEMARHEVELHRDCSDSLDTYKAMNEFLHHKGLPLGDHVRYGHVQPAQHEAIKEEELTDDEKQIAQCTATGIEAVLNLLSKVLPEAYILEADVGYMLDNVMPQPDDVANPSRKMSEALNSYLNDNSSKNRKIVSFDTCVQVSPCTALEILYMNIFCNNPGYAEEFLNYTEYEHNEIHQWQLNFVNTTTSLMVTCTFCEQMIQLETNSMAEKIIKEAREFANAVLEELDNA
ncbi:hypothetical protein L596_013124 [Steinernema carpocapsae]|uniref:Uncharacterized protein n=1 Tax=Steinernema carpocapsae TaxID=34508 RepID=A0A4U5NZ67_STECR|nr:hypothetical protein L596_013124 [Steinernema carpocapsae]